MVLSAEEFWLFFFFLEIKLLCLISFVKPSLSNEIIQSQCEHLTGADRN